MADAIPVHKAPVRPVDPVQDLVKHEVSEEQLKEIPEQFRKAARRALEDGHEVFILGGGRAMRIDRKHEQQ